MIIGSKVILRGKKLADAPDDYAWQTDPELAHLDAAPLPTTSTLATAHIMALMRLRVKLNWVL